nr:RecName: Full=Large ribosomal subunit protein bL12c; AltName: Full=50S ribosomal protein L12, chloroplastic [Chattonella marina var. antiqua]
SKVENIVDELKTLTL